MPRTNVNTTERDLQIGIIEQPASLVIFVFQAANGAENVTPAQIDAARSTAKSVIEMCGATVYGVSDALRVDKAGGRAQVVLRYSDAETEQPAGESDGAGGDNNNNNNNNGGEA